MAATAPPQVGIPVDKTILNSKLGGATQSLRKSYVALRELVDWAAPYDAAALEDAYGFTPEEANLFLSALRGPSDTPALITTVEAFEWLDKTWGA